MVEKIRECDVEGRGRGLRATRLLFGLAIILAGIYFKSWLGLLGVISVVVAVTGFCPLSRLGRSC